LSRSLDSTRVTPARMQPVTPARGLLSHYYAAVYGRYMVIFPSASRSFSFRDRLGTSTLESFDRCAASPRIWRNSRWITRVLYSTRLTGLGGFKKKAWHGGLEQWCKIAELDCPSGTTHTCSCASFLLLETTLLRPHRTSQRPAMLMWKDGKQHLSRGLHETDRASALILGGWLASTNGSQPGDIEIPAGEVPARIDCASIPPPSLPLLEPSAEQARNFFGAYSAAGRGLKGLLRVSRLEIR
jgi:hypothetical protein